MDADKDSGNRRTAGVLSEEVSLQYVTAMLDQLESCQMQETIDRL